VSSGRGLVIPRRLHLTAVVVAAAAIYGAANAASAAAATVANWQMNEPRGATTMHDSSGSNLSGAIGSAVVTGVVANGATGYRWTSEGRDGYRPERLVTVQSARLNPGTSSFAVTIRMSTGAGHQNIVQKGQAGTSGGMFKIDMVRGFVICLYKGSEGRAAIQSAQQVWDNRWHIVRCERRPTGVTLTVDGGTSRTNRGATGNIANSSPLSIGGKWRCDPPTVQCDYYVGRLDWVVVERL
jgi:Laminin G domain